MLDRENKSVVFTGCDFDDAFYRKVIELTAKMKSHDAPYHSSFELEVTKDDGEVRTLTKHSSNLTDEEQRIFNELEVAATEIARGGREPGSVKTEVEIEKDI